MCHFTVVGEDLFDENLGKGVANAGVAACYHCGGHVV